MPEIDYDAMAAQLQGVPGTTLGAPLPDWPADLTTFKERQAYQRGVSHARFVDNQKATQELQENSGLTWEKIADALEACDWSNPSIGNQTILRAAIEALRNTSTAAMPDFDAVRDRRMSELSPAQRADALELWLREQVGWMGEYHEKHYRFLLKRLDEARGTGVVAR